jgi:hypothetical protein
MEPRPEWQSKHDFEVPVAGVVPVQLMKGDDEEETQLLREMSVEADEYLRSFPWCNRVLGSFFGGGVGGIFAVFLFRIDASRPAVGPWIWIVVGDIPPAYLPFEDAESPAEVFRTYMWGMRNWVELARQGRKGTVADNVPPINVPASPEWAEKLAHKLHLLSLLVKPFFDESGESEQVN